MRGKSEAHAIAHDELMKRGRDVGQAANSSSRSAILEMRRRLAPCPAILDLPEPDPFLVEQLPEAFPGKGRGSGLWSRRHVALVLHMIALGYTLTAICATPGFPNKVMWAAWCAHIPELEALYRTAKSLGAGAMADEALNRARMNADDPVNEVTNQATKIVIDTLKWNASKLDPATYGEQRGLPGGITIKIVTNLDLGEEDAPNAPDVLDTELTSGVFVVKARPENQT